MKRVSLLLLIFTSSILHPAFAQTNNETVSISLNTKEAGQQISPLALGLSYETRDLLPDANGDYYFHKENRALIGMFKTIGVGHLRIGGNSVDASNIPLPSERDVHTFFEFAKAADVKVVYSLRLQNGDPEYARQIARILNDNYKDLIESIAVGNEPHYYEDTEVYVEKWASIHDAILEVYPDAVFSGPDTNPSVERMKALIDGFGDEQRRLVQVTQHSYPFGCSYVNPNAGVYLKLVPQNREESRDKMLQPAAYDAYQEVLDKIKEATAGTGLAFRLSETNSYWYSGLREVSNSNASALWALDYLYWWTTNGATGINFHTGDITGGSQLQPAFYAAFVTSKEGYAAMPLAYGMKLFEMGSKGKVLPTDVSNIESTNVVAYSTLDTDGNINLTIINKEYKTNSDQKISVTLDQKIKGKEMRAMELRLSDSDISKIADLTIGGAEIRDDASWGGDWVSFEPDSIYKSTFEFTVPSATAVLIQIR